MLSVSRLAQWGQKYTATDTVVNISFPIAHNNVYSILTAPSSPQDYRIGETCNAIQVTNSSFKISSIGNMALLYFNWVSIGD